MADPDIDDITIIFTDGSERVFLDVQNLVIGTEIRFDDDGRHYVFKITGIAGWSRPIETVPPVE